MVREKLLTGEVVREQPAVRWFVYCNQSPPAISNGLSPVKSVKSDERGGRASEDRGQGSSKNSKR